MNSIRSHGHAFSIADTTKRLLVVAVIVSTTLVCVKGSQTDWQKKMGMCSKSFNDRQVCDHRKCFEQHVKSYMEEMVNYIDYIWCQSGKYKNYSGEKKDNTKYYINRLCSRKKDYADFLFKWVEHNKKTSHVDLPAIKRKKYLAHNQNFYSILGGLKENDRLVLLAKVRDFANYLLRSQGYQYSEAFPAVSLFQSCGGDWVDSYKALKQGLVKNCRGCSQKLTQKTKKTRCNNCGKIMCGSCVSKKPYYVEKPESWLTGPGRKETTGRDTCGNCEVFWKRPRVQKRNKPKRRLVERLSY